MWKRKLTAKGSRKRDITDDESDDVRTFVNITKFTKKDVTRGTMDPTSDE